MKVLKEETYLKTKEALEIFSKDLPEGKTVFSVHVNDLILHEYYYDICSLPTLFWRRIKDSCLAELKGSSIYVEENPTVTVLSCKSSLVEESVKKLREIVTNALKGSIVNSVQDYRIGRDFSRLPDISNLKNYDKETQKLLDLAKEGLEKDVGFKVFLIGDPGTGKTFFSEMMARYLLEKKKVDVVIIESPKSLDSSLSLFEDLELELKLLIIVDEMEVGFIDRGLALTESTFSALQLLDGLSKKSFRFIGISNIPMLLDRALFRPGRIDLLVKMRVISFSEEIVFRILKSLAGNVTESKLKKLSKILAERYQEILPISFYSLALRLYIVYRDLEKVLSVLDIFAENRHLYKGLSKEFSNVGFSTTKESELSNKTRRYYI